MGAKPPNLPAPVVVAPLLRFPKAPHGGSIHFTTIPWSFFHMEQETNGISTSLP